MSTEKHIDVYELQGVDEYNAGLRKMAELAQELGLQQAVATRETAQMKERLEALLVESRKVEEQLEAQRRALDNLNDETERGRRAQEGLVSFMRNDLDNTLLSAQARYDLLKGAVLGAGRAVVAFVTDGFKGIAEEERAVNRLGATIRALGIGSDDLTQALAEQAEAIEKTLHVQGESVMQVQQMLLQWGLAPGAVDKVVRAVLDYSAAMGVDAVTAARTLIQSVDGGNEELKKFGITVTNTGDATKDLTKAADELTKKFGGQAKANTEGLAGQMDALRVAQEDTAKAMATFLTDTGIATTTLKALTTAFNEWKFAFSDGFEEQKAERDKRKSELWGEIERLEKVIAEREKRFREDDDLASLNRNTRHQNDINRLRELQAELAKVEEAGRKAGQAEVERLAKQNAALGGKGATVPTANAGGTGSGKGSGKGRSSGAKAKPDAEVETVADLLALERQEEEAMEQWRAEQRAKEFEGWDDMLAKRQQQMNDEAAAARLLSETLMSEEEKRTQQALAEYEKRKEAARQYNEQVKQEFQSYGMALVSFAAEEYRASLLERTKFNEEYKRLSVERRQADLAEQGVIKSRAEVEREMAKEEIAAHQMRLAEVLANISTQAAIKAVFSTAEGFAMLATGNPLASQAFVAAAAYASAAALAGGAAAGISASRGMTADERGQLERMSGDREQRRTEREAANAQQATGGVGTVVNVYQYGIAGQTEAAQARELARLRQQYDDRRTGAGR